MSIQIGKYNAEGPFLNENQLKDVSGVYVILGRSSQAENWNVVDVGESGGVRSRVSNHGRTPCWKRQSHSTLSVAAIYTGEAERMRIEKELRAQYNPPCGDA